MKRRCTNSGATRGVSASLVLALCVLVPSGAIAQLKIGTVDVGSVVESYSKTKDAQARINESTNAAKKELDERAGAYKAALEEINKITVQLDAPALSADAKTVKAKERDEKIANIRNLEREINEFRQTREQQLRQQTGRIREEILKEVTAVVLERVKAHDMDLVFDRSGASTNGFSPLLFAGSARDLTAEVVTELNKSDRAGTIPPPDAKISPSPRATQPAKP